MAQAVVIGEDLGTVEDEVRQQLTERAVLSYRLVWFEDKPPARYPEQALAAVTTVQLALAQQTWPDGVTVRVRITHADAAAVRSDRPDVGLQFPRREPARPRGCRADLQGGLAEARLRGERTFDRLADPDNGSNALSAFTGVLSKGASSMGAQSPPTTASPTAACSAS